MSAESVLITGGAKRLGRAVALRLASEGHPVWIHCRTSTEEAENLCLEIRSAGGRADWLQADLHRPDERSRLMHDFLSHAESTPSLIHAASNFTPGGPEDADHFQAMLEIHVHAFRDLTQSLWQALPPTSTSRAILFGDSQVGYHGGFFNYRYSKRAAMDLARLLARHLAPRLLVHIVAPGPVLPAENDVDGSRFTQIVEKTPLRHSPGSGAIQDAVSFLMKATWSTGQILYVDAGQHLTQDLG